MQRMLDRDVTRVMQSLSRVRQNLASERRLCRQAAAVLLSLVPSTLWIPISRNQEIIRGPIIFIK